MIRHNGMQMKPLKNPDPPGEPMNIEDSPDGTGDLERIYAEYAPSMFRTALKITRCREKALDVVQEVFLRYIDKHGQIRNLRSPGSWLYRVTVNCALDIRREMAAGRRHVDEFRAESADSSDPVPISPREEEAVFREVEKLPEKQKQAVIMRFFLGDSLKEIALTLNCTYDSARVTLYRALKRLRGKLVRAGGRNHV